MPANRHQQPPVTTSPRQRLALLILLLIAPLTAPNPASADHIDTWFAAPFSGKKVNEYRVELSVDKDRRANYLIPYDCQAASQARAQSGLKWASPRERHLWHKVKFDCDYYAVMHRTPTPPVRDLVSGLNLFNTGAEQLPEVCDRNGENCTNLLLKLTTPAPLPKAPSATAPPDQHRLPSQPQGARRCAIRNGVFRGQPELNQAGQLRCEKTEANPRRVPGFRVLAVDYCDINGDGYQDALLRYLPLGTANRKSQLMGISRTAPDGPWQTVELPL